MVAIKWESIDITDKFMFGSVFSDPELCRELLEIVLGVPIKKVVIVRREHDLVPGLGSKGIRMDVYVNDAAGTVYDVEMQNENKGSLEMRSRYYQSTIDIDCINPGEDYSALRKSFIVFICKFDPFKRGLVRYTVTPHCKEDGVEMDDGSTRLFVNARAWESCSDERLKAFLRYVSQGIIGDEFTKKVDKAVCGLREKPAWRAERMRMSDYLAEERREARAEGHAEGHAEGLAEGLAEGRTEGLAEGHADISTLYMLLKSEGRLDEFEAAMHDKEKLNQLLDTLINKQEDSA